MSDDEHRGVGADRRDRPGQRLLVAGVQRGRRLVQQQQRRSAQQGPRDGQALPLPAGQQDAVVADLGVEPVGTAAGQLAEVDLLQRCEQLRVRGTRSTEQQVVAQRPGQHRGVLLDVGHGGPQAPAVQAADVQPADEHRPGGRLVEPLDQGEHRGLPRPRGPDQRRTPAGGCRERGAEQHRTACGVGEHDVVEAHLDGLGGVQRRGGDITRRLLGQVQHLLDAGQRTEAGLHRRQRLDALCQRLHQQEQQQHEGDQVPDGDGPTGHPRPAHAEDGQERALHGDGRERAEQCPQPGQLQPCHEGVVGEDRHGGALPLLGAGGPDGAHPGQRPLDAGGHRPDGGLRGQRRRTDPAYDDDRAREADRHRGHGDAEQQQVDRRHRDQGSHGDDEPGDDVDEAGGDDGAQQGGVGADSGDEVTGAPAVELGDG